MKIQNIHQLFCPTCFIGLSIPIFDIPYLIIKLVVQQIKRMKKKAFFFSCKKEKEEGLLLCNKKEEEEGLLLWCAVVEL